MIKTRQIKRQTEKYTPPEGYLSVPVLSWQPKYTKYFELSPYHLRTDGKEEHVNLGNVLFENFWQGSKVYPIVYPITVNPHWAYNQVNADGTFDVTLEKLEVLKHDTSEAYGHGLCLAEALLEDVIHPQNLHSQKNIQK